MTSRYKRVGMWAFIQGSHGVSTCASIFIDSSRCPRYGTACLGTGRHAHTHVHVPLNASSGNACTLLGALKMWLLSSNRQHRTTSNEATQSHSVGFEPYFYQQHQQQSQEWRTSEEGMAVGVILCSYRHRCVRQAERVEPSSVSREP